MGVTPHRASLKAAESARGDPMVMSIGGSQPRELAVSSERLPWSPPENWEEPKEDTECIATSS
jgi:hypothetical protein